MKIDKKRLLPHGLAFLLFFALSSIYFYPALKGYSLKQGDIKQWAGMSKDVRDHREAHDDEALWTNGMFGGMPAYQISLGNKGSVLEYVKALQKVFPRPPIYFFFMMIAFYILGMSLKVRPELAALGAVAFGFSTFFIVSMEAGHTGKVHAIAYMPAVVAGAVYILRKKYALGGVIFALALGLQLNANHYQITYYTGLTVGMILIFEAVKAFRNKEFPHIGKTLGLLVAGGLLAVSANITQFWTTYEYMKSSMRGDNELTIEAKGGSDKTEKSGGLDRDYITQWSLGIGETWSLAIPNAKGGASGALGQEEKAMKEVPRQLQRSVAGMNRYWGQQPFTAGPVYIGAIIVLLFLLGAFTVSHRFRWPIITAIVFSIMLAWGRNFYTLTDFFIDYFPLYNRFRTVTMTLTVAQLLMPVLGILFLKELFEKEGFWEENKKKILGVSGTFIGIMILFLIMPGAFFDFISPEEIDRLDAQKGSNPEAASMIDQVKAAMQDARMKIFTSDVFRSLFFVIAGVGLILAGVYKKLNPRYALIALVALITIDLWTVDKRYLDNEKQGRDYVQWEKKEDKSFPYTPEQFDEQIFRAEINSRPEVQKQIEANLSEAQKNKRRISSREEASIRFATLDSMSHYRVLDLVNNTYNSARTAYFHKDVGGYNAAKLMRYQQLIDFHMSRGSGNFNQSVLNMLNTKYIIQQSENGANISQNPNALGSCWFAESINTVADADEEINALGDFNPREEAVIDQRFSELITQENYAADGSIELTGYKLNHMTYTVNAPQKSFAVFSEIYYQPGWQAYIDGEPSEHARVNWTLRGMEIPAGTKKVEFKFEPKSYHVGKGISFAGSLVLILLALGLFIKKYRDKNLR